MRSSLLITGLLALALTVYIATAPGLHYFLDGAAVVAWIALAREVALATP